jgi:hypothetical protein
MNCSPVASAAGELLRERDRVVGRLASMPLDTIPERQVLGAVQQLADLVSRARGEPWHEVPRLAPYAVADQVTVLVGEVIAAAEGRDEVTRAGLLGPATQIVGNLRRSLT